MSGKRVTPPIAGKVSTKWVGRDKRGVGIGRSPSALVRGVQLSAQKVPDSRYAVAALTLRAERDAIAGGLPVPPIYGWQHEQVKYAALVEGDMLPGIVLRKRYALRGWKPPEDLQPFPDVGVRKTLTDHKKALKEACEGKAGAEAPEKEEMKGEGREIAELRGSSSEKWSKWPSLLSPLRRYSLLKDASKIKIKWAPITFYRPELVVPKSRKKKTSRNWRRADQGERIGEIWKVASDGEIFSDLRLSQGGSLLIDCSGSMGLSGETIEKLVVNAPRMVIGKYGGSSAYKQGWLQIVASKGLIARPEELRMSYGSANRCDGDALLWLAAQPAPRFWYSDGAASDYSEDNWGRAREAAETLCLAHNIHRVETPKDLFRKLGIRNEA